MRIAKDKTYIPPCQYDWVELKTGNENLKVYIAEINYCKCMIQVNFVDGRPDTTVAYMDGNLFNFYRDVYTAMTSMERYCNVLAHKKFN